jgi:hypothetical protein
MKSAVIEYEHDAIFVRALPSGTRPAPSAQGFWYFRNGAASANTPTSAPRCSASRAEHRSGQAPFRCGTQSDGLSRCCELCALIRP